MQKNKLDIIYEDKEIIVINKKAHLLTISNDKEKYNTLYHQVYEYLKKKNKNNKVFIVHRLDKDTSGIVLFAKSEKMKKMLQDEWNDLAIVREYYAIVEGCINKSGVVKQYLSETNTLLTYISDKKRGKYAETHYEVLKSCKAHTILKVNIKTGRKNQIRVAMQSINHPIIGDKKYGSHKNPLRRLCLHASKLVIINPITKKEMEFISKIPKEFKIFE